MEAEEAVVAEATDPTPEAVETEIVGATADPEEGQDVRAGTEAVILKTGQVVTEIARRQIDLRARTDQIDHRVLKDRTVRQDLNVQTDRSAQNVQLGRKDRFVRGKIVRIRVDILLEKRR